MLVLQFPEHTETRTVMDRPRFGQRIQSPNGETFFVVGVTPIGRRSYSTHCVGRSAFWRELRRQSPRDMASHLIAAVRTVVDSQTANVDDADHEPRQLILTDDWIDSYLARSSGEKVARRPDKTRPSRELGDWIEGYLEKVRRASTFDAPRHVANRPSRR